MCKISVIVPVYKAENYLRDCVDSILQQSFQDFEIILVNDGSPDNSGAICDELSAKESRIAVIHQTNQGQAAARNHALAQAKGEWICFVDSDDLIHPQMLQLLYEAVEESGAGISMCQMLEAVELPAQFERPVEKDYQVLTMDEQTLVKLHDQDAYPAWVGCAKLIRRELIEAYPFREGRVYEDNEAVCRWVCQAGTLAKYDHELYFYRTNPESTSATTFITASSTVSSWVSSVASVEDSSVASSVGSSDGVSEGSSVGSSVDSSVASSVGSSVASSVASSVGSSVLISSS